MKKLFDNKVLEKELRNLMTIIDSEELVIKDRMINETLYTFIIFTYSPETLSRKYETKIIICENEILSLESDLTFMYNDIKHIENALKKSKIKNL